MEMNRQPALISHPHALVGDGREISYAGFLERETLRAYIERTGIVVPAGPVAVWHNGCRVPDALWERLIPRAGDLVIIRARALGGSGGGSKILRSVAMIAIVIASVYTGGLIAGVWGAVASAGIMIGGSLLINALLPLPKATTAQLGTTAKYESNPTYAISGGRNRARPWEPMMLIFGRHKVVPDLASQPYSEYVGDDQYLNQAFHLGLQNWQGNWSDFKIGDTPITNFQGVQLQGSDIKGNLTLFPGNVDTIQGFVLSSADGWNSRTTPIDTTYISVELAASLFYANDDGTIAWRSADYQLQYRQLPSGAWNSVGTIGATYATHYWSLREKATNIWGQDGAQIRYGSTNFADHTDGQTELVGTTAVSAPPEIQFNFWWSASSTEPAEVVDVYGVWRWVPHPFALGQPWQGVAPDPLLTPATAGIRLSGQRQEATRQTIGWSVAQGQYDVRIQKTTADIKDTRESNESAVNQILCYQPDTADYSGQWRLAVRIKATAQLNGAIDEFSAICSMFCYVWNEPTWVWAESSNPAWWFLWYARGARKTNGDRIYGAGFADTQIEIEAIKAWGIWCDQKKLTFNYVLTEKKSVHDVLTMIARAGRASYTWQTGKLGVIWDAANLPVVAMIGPYNIKAGTFEVNYANDATADEVVINFVNPNRNWQLDSVRVQVPNVAKTNTTATLDLDGCTDVDMAGREANLIAASQAFQRRRVSWEMDIEGMVATRGDVVQFSHDLTVWSYAGRCLGLTRTMITLDRTVPSGGTGWVSLRDPSGTMQLIQVSAPAGDTEGLTIITALPADFPVPGDAGYEDIVPMDWAWQFDPLATPGRRIKIIDAQPSGEDGVKFIGIDDDPDYYASETNLYGYTPPRDGALLGGVIFGVTFSEEITSVAGDMIRVTAFWSSASSDTKVQVIVSINGVAQPAITTLARTIDLSAHTGDVIKLAVTPIPASGRGTTFNAAYTVQGLLAPLPTVTGLTNVFRDGLTALVWDRVIDVRTPTYEVRLGSTWINSRTVAITSNLDILAIGNGLYFVAARFATAAGIVIYGTPDSLQISGATLVRNVLVTVGENPAWPGTAAGGAIVLGDQLTLAGTGDILACDDVLALDDVLWYGGVESSGTYQTDPGNVVDIGYATPVRVDFTIAEFALNFHENVLALDDVLAAPDILNESNRQHYKVRPQICSAGNDGVFTPWRDYVPGLINARYFDVRLVLDTDDALIVPFVTEFSWTIDVPDLVQQDINLTIPAAGLHVTYPKPFHAKPNVQIATYDAQDGDRYVLSNATETGHDIQMINGTTAVSRNINGFYQGY